MHTDHAPSLLATTSISVLLGCAVWMTIGAVLRLSYPLVQRRVLTLTGRHRANLLLALQCLPAALAVCTVTLMYSPLGAQLLVSPHCHEAMGCGAHAPTATLARHDHWLIAIAVMPVLLAAWRLVQAVTSHQRRRHQLTLLTGPKRFDDCLIIDSADAIAFTFGLLRPRTYLSQGLVDGLDAPQLQAVIAHERAHCQRRDGLRRFAVHLLSVPGHRSSRMATDWHDALEHAADEIASVGGVSSMAQALICSHRLRPEGVGGDHGLEARIGNLLHPRVERLLDRWLPVLSLIAVPIIAVISVDSGHALLDWLLGHL